ncbi:MAG: hypothetical protein PF450_06690 [Bacteroidales bacterium]|jgi:hypothetical protein|nr:hypothetical protein [Bacteroidales bacterium]
MSVRTKYNAVNTQNKMDFGIHDNVVLRKVSIEPRKKDDGTFQSMHMFFTYTQIDPATGKLLSEQEFNTFPVRPDSKNLEYSVMREVNRLAAIFECYMTEAQVDQIFDPFKVVGIDNTEQIESVLSNKANMDKFNQAMRESFFAAIQPFLGLDSKYRFRLKVIFSRDGKYRELARDRFIESMGIPKDNSELVLTTQDLRTKSEASKAVRADSGAPAYAGVPGAAPATGAYAPPPVPGMMKTPGTVGMPAVPTPATPAMGLPTAAAPAAATPAPADAPFNTPVPVSPTSGNPLGEVPSVAPTAVPVV